MKLVISVLCILSAVVFTIADPHNDDAHHRWCKHAVSRDNDKDITGYLFEQSYESSDMHCASDITQNTYTPIGVCLFDPAYVNLAGNGPIFTILKSHGLDAKGNFIINMTSFSDSKCNHAIPDSESSEKLSTSCQSYMEGNYSISYRWGYAKVSSDQAFPLHCIIVFIMTIT